MRAGGVSGPAKVALIVLGALAVGLLLWDVSNREENRVKHHLQFERSTEWDRKTVDDCLRYGNGSKFFEGYYSVSNSVGNWRGAPETDEPLLYMNSAGASLIIEYDGRGTKVRFKSSQQPTEMQKDVLEWCVEHPHYTWIAPQFRAGFE